MKNIFIIIFMTLVVSETDAQSFKQQQMKHERVKVAYKEREQIVKDELAKVGINDYNFQLLIVALKQEKQLETWVRKTAKDKFVLLKTFAICRSSGDLGPKRQYGDGQVPEGFYELENFNPISNFYLSLRVSYPNQSDRILKTSSSAGNDIYIHGNCVTIGCIPLDDDIKELYILALEAKQHGQQRIPIWIFPTKLTAENYKNICDKNADNKILTEFWKTLKIGYDYFETNKSLPKIRIDAKGKYLFD